MAQYRTTVKQKELFEDLLNGDLPEEGIPIEWVIDIADESNGWFYGTAYHYDDEKNLLHVMVPDKDNPTFDGHVSLDHRTVHLVECVDDYSHALFNKIVRDSVVKVRWEVEWFEEGDEDDEGQETNGTGEDATKGQWILTMARYFIRIANQLLVEEVQEDGESKGFVMLTADVNVKLMYCHKMKGAEDFARLIKEGTVQATDRAMGSLKEEVEGTNAKHKKEGRKTRFTDKDITQGATGRGQIRMLEEMTKGLKDSLCDVLDDREKVCNDRAKMAKAFRQFALHGDLDSGLKLLSFVDDLDTAEQDALDTMADEAWFLCQKVEKTVEKLAAGGGEASGRRESRRE